MSDEAFQEFVTVATSAVLDAWREDTGGGVLSAMDEIDLECLIEGFFLDRHPTN